MKTRLSILLTIILLVSAFSGCSSNSDISFVIIEKSGYFKVGYDPESYHTYDGYGLAINIIKHAADRMGVEAPIKPVNDYDWEANLYNEDIDVMLCKSTNENLQTTAVFNDSVVLISHDPNSIQTIGVIDSKACVEQKNILSYDKVYEYKYYSNKDLLLNDLSINIVDAAIMSEYDALSSAETANYNTQILSESPIYFIVSNKKQSFFDALNAVLQQMSLDGTTERLKREYINGLN